MRDRTTASGPGAALFPSLLVFGGASVWGLYWLPLREVEALGLAGPWTLALFNALPLACLVPLVVLRAGHWRRHWRAALLIGLFSGIGLGCYALGLVYTTIMRATLLYYLTPVWSTIIAMALLGERVTWGRWLAIAIGLAGLYLLLFAGASRVNASPVGDAVGFMSGLLWGFAAACLRLYPDVAPQETVPAQYLFATLTGVVGGLALLAAGEALPTTGSLLGAMQTAAAFGVLVLMPSVFAIFWAAQRLSPGRVGILMMSEVAVAAVSASLIAGESLTLSEAAGVVLILVAGIVEVAGPSQPPRQGGT